MEMEKENFNEEIFQEETLEKEISIQEGAKEEIQVDINIHEEDKKEIQAETSIQEIEEKTELEEKIEEDAEVKSETEAEVKEEVEEKIIKDPNARWYVIHTYSGYENKVKSNLLKRINSMEMQDKIFTILVPTEEEIEFRDGKRRTVQKKIYPGYVYVEMVMTNESWNVVRNTAGVTGFVGPQGSGFKPIPLGKEEVQHIRRLMGIDAQIKIKLSIEKGQGVRVKSGPFRDFTGIVDEIYSDREKVRVLIYIFGRETPVELDFGQIEKL